MVRSRDELAAAFCHRTDGHDIGPVVVHSPLRPHTGAGRLRGVRLGCTVVADEPLINAAARMLRAAATHLSGLDGPPAHATVTSDDITFDDRRSGGANFGLIESSNWLEFVTSIWSVGTGHPHFTVPDVVAVRGQRCAAVIWAYDYGDGWADAQILCIRLNPGRLIDRAVAFAVDDVVAAIAELDRWHAEIEG